MKSMFKPSHPGRIIRDDYIEPLEITIKEVANILGVTRQTLDAIVNERSGISPEMSLRLSKAFDTTPEFWLNLQRNFDLAIVRKKFKSINSIRTIYKRGVTPN